MATSPLVGPTDVDLMLLRLQDRLNVLEQTAVLAPGIVAWCATVCPDGWLVCDGSTISAARYGQLVARLGGTTLPDIRGRVIVGQAAAGTFITMLATGGLEVVTLTAAQSGMPAHEHTYLLPSVIAQGTPAGGNINAGGLVSTATTGGAGQSASASHTNMPPFIVLLPIIKF